MNIAKCDCCNQFDNEAELETVTLVVHKHKNCNVNVLFGHQPVASAVSVFPTNAPTAIVGGAPMPDLRSRDDKQAAIINELKKQPIPVNRIL